MPKQNAIIVDLDGCLAIIGKRNPYDASTCEQDQLNALVASTVLFFAYKCQVIVVTGRKKRDEEPTRRWLKKHGIPFVALYMRPNDYTGPASELKELLYQGAIREKYNVILALEDSRSNAEMYRGLGIPCWQVDTDPRLEKGEENAPKDL